MIPVVKPNTHSRRLDVVVYAWISGRRSNARDIEKCSGANRENDRRQLLNSFGCENDARGSEKSAELHADESRQCFCPRPVGGAQQGIIPDLQQLVRDDGETQCSPSRIEIR
jgi:hypothetical protein